MVKQNNNLRFGSHIVKYDDPEKGEIHEYLTSAPKGKENLIEKFIVQRQIVPVTEKSNINEDSEEDDEDYEPDNVSYSSSDDSEYSDASEDQETV
jgi:hypothetical protein